MTLNPFSVRLLFLINLIRVRWIEVSLFFFHFLFSLSLSFSFHFFLPTYFFNSLYSSLSNLQSRHVTRLHHLTFDLHLISNFSRVTSICLPLHLIWLRFTQSNLSFVYVTIAKIAVDKDLKSYTASSTYNFHTGEVSALSVHPTGTPCLDEMCWTVLHCTELCYIVLYWMSWLPFLDYSFPFVPFSPRLPCPLLNVSHHTFFFFTHRQVRVIDVQGRHLVPGRRREHFVSQTSALQSNVRHLLLLWS